MLVAIVISICINFLVEHCFTRCIVFSNNNMDKVKVGIKKNTKRDKRKVVAGIKLPPIDTINTKELKTIMDIDPAFYSLVDGRPIRPNTSFHVYKHNIKDIGLKRTLQGFLIDEILRINREIDSEKNIYRTTSKHFEEYQNSFDKFLADNNNKTIAIMRKSDTLARDLVNQTEEHKQANYEMASLKSKLQYIDETLIISLSFQDFLNNASPILWQEKNNITMNVKYSEIFFMDTNIFHKVDIDYIAKQLNSLPFPKLFFETPDQLITVFNMLEKQNLNYLLITEELNAEKNKYLKALDILKEMLREELATIQQKINAIEEMIKQNEMREVEVKEIFYKILHDKIKYLVSSEMALQIFNYVEFTYEHLIAPNDANLNSLDMAQALEREYDHLMLDISKFNLENIREIEAAIYDIGTKDIKRAEEASKLLEDVDKLNSRLKSCYEPARKKKIE